MVVAAQIALALEMAAMKLEGRGGWWEAPDPSTKTAKREAALLSAGDMEAAIDGVGSLDIGRQSRGVRRERERRRSDAHRLLLAEAVVEVRGGGGEGGMYAGSRARASHIKSSMGMPWGEGLEDAVKALGQPSEEGRVVVIVRACDRHVS